MYICMHAYSHMRLFLPRFGAYPNHKHITIIVKKKTCLKRKEKTEKRKENTTTQIGTIVMARGCNAGLLARSQFASGRSCDRPTRSWFSLVPEQMLSWYPNSTLHCMLQCSPPNGSINNFAQH
jgi:hypothetical protein